MADPFATIDDVEVLFGEPMDTATQALATRLLRMAAHLMRAKVVTIDARITAYNPSTIPPTGLDPDVAVDVNAAMVVRVLRNPAGAVSEAVGPSSVTYGKTSGQLTLTEDEITLLAGAPPRPSIGTVRLGAALAPKVRPFGRFGPTFTRPERDW
jgi:hypothetical protein